MITELPTGRHGVYLLCGRRDTYQGRPNIFYIGESAEVEARVCGRGDIFHEHEYRAFLLHVWPGQVSKRARLEMEARFIHAAKIVGISRLTNEIDNGFIGNEPLDKEIATLREIWDFIRPALITFPAKAEGRAA